MNFKWVLVYVTFELTKRRNIIRILTLSFDLEYTVAAQKELREFKRDDSLH